MMKTTRKTFIGLITSFLCIGIAFGQKAERRHIRKGNELYGSEKYTEAEIAYRKSKDVNPRSVEGTYDLGNALYRQHKFPEAADQYQLVIDRKEQLIEEDKGKNTLRIAQALHNMGNIGMEAALAARKAGNIGMSNQEYAKSIEAYKASLRLNPKDDETRYNLALAQKMLRNQQNEDQQQQQQNQQDNKQNEEQQQQQQDRQKTQEEQQQNEKMSEDNAQQILDAFLQDEKDTQEKIKQAQKQQQRRRSDKQW
ncbi:MAG: tetratricopeptide repeat protein [Tannerella sp.]|jgi:tetratricopeptide (TPR) repeat protein|nr:tetratricopeptide repeat protein [Tannerella sp.]